MREFLPALRIFLAVCVVAVSALACGSSPTASPPPAQTSAPATSAPATSVPAVTEAPATEAISAETLDGTYNISGKDPNGKDYTGTLSIQLNQAYSTGGSTKFEVYDMSWSNGTAGAGMLVNDMLATSFGTEACGAIFYAVDSDMKLGGLWLTLNTKEIGTEDATPTAARSTLEGDYSVSGTNPDNSTYSGTLNMKQQGDVWQMTWNAGQVYDGIGIAVSDQLLAGAYGGQGCGVAVYIINSDGSLKGIWGMWGVNQLGTENAAK